jgi:hypothetical protein
MNASGTVSLQLHAFLISDTYGGKWSVLRSGYFTPEREGVRSAGWTTERVGTRIDLDIVMNRNILAPAGIEPRLSGQ